MFITVRFFFDSLLAAVDALTLVLEDARTTSKSYSFGALSAEQVFTSGLLIVGEADEVAAKVEALGNSIRYDE